MLLLLAEVVTTRVQVVHVVLQLTIITVKAPFVVVLRLLQGHHRLHHTELQGDLLLLTIEELQPAVRLLEVVVLVVHMIVAAVLPLLLVAPIHQVTVVAHVPAVVIQVVVVLPAQVVEVVDPAEAEEDNKYNINSVI